MFMRMTLGSCLTDKNFFVSKQWPLPLQIHTASEFVPFNAKTNEKQCGITLTDRQPKRETVQNFRGYLKNAWICVANDLEASSATRSIFNCFKEEIYCFIEGNSQRGQTGFISSLADACSALSTFDRIVKQFCKDKKILQAFGVLKHCAQLLALIVVCRDSMGVALCHRKKIRSRASTAVLIAKTGSVGTRENKERRSDQDKLLMTETGERNRGA